MIVSKFGIGQQVRHRISGILGVIVDIDPEYSLEAPNLEDVGAAESLRKKPWYHVVMEDEQGDHIYTYVAEVQLSIETILEHPEQPSMDRLAESIKKRMQVSYLLH